jgi:hypothetical protein
MKWQCEYNLHLNGYYAWVRRDGREPPNWLVDIETAGSWATIDTKQFGSSRQAKAWAIKRINELTKEHGYAACNEEVGVG